MALTNGTNLGLLVNGSPGEEHYNKLMEQWRGFDALIQAVAIDKDLTTPPASPNNGDVYVVGVGAIGLWTGRDNKIARFSSTIASWEFFTPKKGWQIFLQDEDLVYRFTGTVWEVFGGQDGDPGPTGPAGHNGWSPKFALELDGERRVLKVVDWVGGEGTKPNVNVYVGTTGFVTTIADAVDLRGPQGADGVGSSTTWETLSGKPDIIASGTTEEDARQSIGVGTGDIFRLTNPNDAAWIDVYGDRIALSVTPNPLSGQIRLQDGNSGGQIAVDYANVAGSVAWSGVREQVALRQGQHRMALMD